MGATTRQVDVGATAYQVVDDRSIPYTAVAVLALRDGVHNGPPRGAVHAVVDFPGLRATVANSGVVVLGADLESTLSLWSWQTYAMTVRIDAEGYQPVDVPIVLAPGAAIPVVLPDQLLEPHPVDVVGTVARAGRRPRDVVVGARVYSFQATGPYPTLLRTRLVHPHPAGEPVTAVVVSAAGAPAPLLRAARLGDGVVTLGDRRGLRPGVLLQFGSSESVSFGEVAPWWTIPDDPASAGEVSLTAPLTRGHAAGESVTGVAVVATPPTARTTERVVSGRSVVLLDERVVPGPFDVVRIGDPTMGRSELHGVGAVTNSRGRYSFGGVDGTAAIGMQATDGHTATSRPWVVDYREPTNVVDLVIR